MPACAALSSMVAEEAPHWIVNCHLAHHCDCHILAEIIIEILGVHRLSPLPGAGWRRMGRRIAAPVCHDVRRLQVISVKKLTE